MKIENKSCENKDALNQKLFHSIYSLDPRTTDTERELFFENGADKLSRKCLGHLG